MNTHLHVGAKLFLARMLKEPETKTHTHTYTQTAETGAAGLQLSVSVGPGMAEFLWLALEIASTGHTTGDSLLWHFSLATG